MKFSEKAQRCELSPMRKFHPYAVAAEQRGVRILHLNIGQPDIPTPRQYFDAVKNFAEPVVAYAPSPGIPSLNEAIRGYYKKLGVSLDEGDVLVTTGGSEALLITMLCILNEGDEIIVPEPFYPNYSTFVTAAGGRVRPVPTTPEDGYRYAFRERIEPLINERTRAILLTTPGNPTGTVLQPDEMRMFADLAKEYGLWLVCDEVYREFSYETERACSFGTFSDISENLILIDSASKRFSACGARIGALITKNREMQQNALKFCQARLSVATLDQVAAAALYGVEDGYFLQTREEYRRRRDTICRALHQIPGVVCVEPAGAFYLMAKLPVDNADTFQKFLLEEFSDHGETVMFAPGESFYATPGCGVDEVRIAYVLECERLTRAAELLSLGIEAYHKKQAR